MQPVCGTTSRCLQAGPSSFAPSKANERRRHCHLLLSPEGTGLSGRQRSWSVRSVRSRHAPIPAPLRKEPAAPSPSFNDVAPVNLPQGLPPLDRPQRYFNAISLALLGDAVWELYVRQYCMFGGHGGVGSDVMRREIKKHVMAEAQMTALHRLKASGQLSPAEIDVIEWAMNARVTAPPRFKKSNLSNVVYKEATALEALVGYLYLSDRGRLQDIMDTLHLGTPNASFLKKKSAAGRSEAEPV